MNERPQQRIIEDNNFPTIQTWLRSFSNISKRMKLFSTGIVNNLTCLIKEKEEELTFSGFMVSINTTVSNIATDPA